jgi:hypothetical protein
VSCGDGDHGILAVHVDAIEGGSILPAIIWKSKLREFENSIHQVFIPQEPRIGPWLRFIVIIRRRGRVLKGWTVINQ